MGLCICAPADMMSPVAIISPTAQNDYATRMSAGDTPEYNI